MRKPIRAATIFIKNSKVLLIHRINNGQEYWVFPGGGVEEGETTEDAAARELKEETSIKGKLIKLLYHHYLGNSDQYFYLTEYISGSAKLGNFNEQKDKISGKSFYEPTWINVDKLPELLVYPLEIRDWLIDDLKNGFRNQVREAALKISDLRQSL